MMRNRHLLLLAPALLMALTTQAQTPVPYRPGYTYKVETAIPNTEVYVSGQRPFDANGNLVGAGDIAAQTQQVFQNLQAALAEFGMTFSNIKQVTYHLKGVTGQRDAVAEQRVSNVSGLYLPRSTARIEATKVIPQIISNDVLIEVEVIAAK